MGGSYGLFGYLDDILALTGSIRHSGVRRRRLARGGLAANADSTYMDASFYLVRVTARPISHWPLRASRSTARRKKTISRDLCGGSCARLLHRRQRTLYCRQRDAGETKVNSYAFKERTEGTRLALRAAVGSLKSFNTRFGAYPYTSLMWSARL